MESKTTFETGEVKKPAAEGLSLQISALEDVREAVYKLFHICEGNAQAMEQLKKIHSIAANPEIWGYELLP